MLSIDDSSIVIAIFKENEHGIPDDLICVQPWMDELPVVGHNIEFTHEDKFYRAQIIDIIWRLGTTSKTKNMWMNGKSILINAISEY